MKQVTGNCAEIGGNAKNVSTGALEAGSLPDPGRQGSWLRGGGWSRIAQAGRQARRGGVEGVSFLNTNFGQSSRHTGLPFGTMMSYLPASSARRRTGRPPPDRTATAAAC